MSLRSWGVALVLSLVAFLAPVGAGAAAAQAQPSDSGPVYGPGTGSLSGRMDLPEGVDPTTVSVVGKRWDSSLEAWRVHAWMDNVPLAADGSWTLTQLPPGTYLLQVFQPARTLAVRTSYPRGDFDPQPIQLAENEQRTGVDFAVPLGATLAGTLRVPAGVDAESLSVGVHPKRSDGTFSGPHQIAVAADGSWSADRLVPGTYRVSAGHHADAIWPAFLGGADLKRARDVVVTAGGVVTGLDLAVRRSGGLTGRVDLSDLTEEKTRRCITATAYTRGANGWTSAGESKVSEDGSYAVRGLRTGTHRLGFRDTCENWPARVGAATQFFPNALQVDHAADLAVTDGTDRAVGTVAAAPAGHVSGLLYVYDRAVLHDSEGRRVELLRRSPTGWQVVAEQRTVNGSYRFTDIPVGEYRIGFARGDKELRELFYPDALTLAEARTFTVSSATSNVPMSLGATKTWRRNAKVAVRSPVHVTGKARVGRSLRTYPPSYVQQEAVTVRYQWQVRRHGKVRNIDGATTRRLKLKARHRGAKVRLRVIATAKGHQRHVHRSPWSSPVRGR